MYSFCGEGGAHLLVREAGRDGSLLRLPKGPVDGQVQPLTAEWVRSVFSDKYLFRSSSLSSLSPSSSSAAAMVREEDGVEVEEERVEVEEVEVSEQTYTAIVAAVESQRPPERRCTPLVPRACIGLRIPDMTAAAVSVPVAAMAAAYGHPSLFEQPRQQHARQQQQQQQQQQHVLTFEFKVKCGLPSRSPFLAAAAAAAATREGTSAFDTEDTDGVSNGVTDSTTDGVTAGVSEGPRAIKRDMGRFRLMQLYKAHGSLKLATGTNAGTINTATAAAAAAAAAGISRYDPRDLCSRDPVRVRAAITALMENPRNNFRVWMNSTPLSVLPLRHDLESVSGSAAMGAGDNGSTGSSGVGVGDGAYSLRSACSVFMSACTCTCGCSYRTKGECENECVLAPSLDERQCATLHDLAGAGAKVVNEDEGVGVGVDCDSDGSAVDVVLSALSEILCGEEVLSVLEGAQALDQTLDVEGCSVVLARAAHLAGSEDAAVALLEQWEQGRPLTWVPSPLSASCLRTVPVPVSVSAPASGSGRRSSSGVDGGGRVSPLSTHTSPSAAATSTTTTTTAAAAAAAATTEPCAVDVRVAAVYEALRSLADMGAGDADANADADADTASGVHVGDARRHAQHSTAMEWVNTLDLEGCCLVLQLYLVALAAKDASVMVRFVAGPHWAERSADRGADRGCDEAEQEGITCTCASPRPLVKLIDVGPKPASKIRKKVDVEGDICTKAAAVHKLLQPGWTRWAGLHV